MVFETALGGHRAEHAKSVHTQHDESACDGWAGRGKQHGTTSRNA